MSCWLGQPIAASCGDLNLNIRIKAVIILAKMLLFMRITC
jgi:hypothetical protein